MTILTPSPRRCRGQDIRGFTLVELLEEKGASHQIWVTFHLSYFWWLAPFVAALFLAAATAFADDKPITYEDHVASILK
jgi:hypothetical protein